MRTFHKCCSWVIAHEQKEDDPAGYIGSTAARAVNKANHDKKTPHGIIETAGGLVSAFSSQQYLGKARGLEDLHDALRDVYDRKALLASQPFPYYQQRAQACRGDIVEIGEVDADPLHLPFR